MKPPVRNRLLFCLLSFDQLRRMNAPVCFPPTHTSRGKATPYPVEYLDMAVVDRRQKIGFLRSRKEHFRSNFFDAVFRPDESVINSHIIDGIHPPDSRSQTFEHDIYLSPTQPGRV